MAETKVRGRDYILLADLDNNGTWKPVACLTSNALNTTLDTIDANSKCGNETLPGDVISQTLDFDGHAIDQTGTASKESWTQLYEALEMKTVFPARFAKAVPASGDPIFEGDVFCNELNITSDDNDTVKFNGTFTVTNPPMSLISY
jgi:predicted secreted protein